MFPDQTAISTLTIQGVNFGGPVEVTTTCCLDAITRQPVPVSGIVVGVVPGQLTLPRGETMQARLVAFTGDTPSFRPVVVRVTVRGQEGGPFRTPPVKPVTVEGTVDVLLHVLPSIPEDGAPPSCASPPFEVLPLTALIKGLFAKKLANPSQTVFTAGLVTKDQRNAWTMQIEPDTGTPGLRPNEVRVVFENQTDGAKEILAFNSVTCTPGDKRIDIAKSNTGCSPI